MVSSPSHPSARSLAFLPLAARLQTQVDRGVAGCLDTRTFTGTPRIKVVVQRADQNRVLVETLAALESRLKELPGNLLFEIAATCNVFAQKANEPRDVAQSFLQFFDQLGVLGQFTHLVFRWPRQRIVHALRQPSRGEPPSGDLFPPPTFRDAGHGAQHHMEVVRHDGLKSHVDGEDAGQLFLTREEPAAAVRVVAASEWVLAGEKGAADAAVPDVERGHAFGAEELLPRIAGHGDISPSARVTHLPDHGATVPILRRVAAPSRLSAWACHRFSRNSTCRMDNGDMHMSSHLS